MIDQRKLDADYVEGLEKVIDQVGAELETAQRDLDRYRQDNLELQGIIEEQDRTIDDLRVRSVRMQGAIEQATDVLQRAYWTPRRSGAEAER